MNSYKKIVEKQQQSTKNVQQKELLGIYVHIPFCEKKCDYCDFISFCKNDEYKSKYVNALLKEISFTSSSYKNYVIDTIFIGGGTPTCLPNGEIFKIISQIKKCFNVSKNAEITVECNPNSLTSEKLDEFKIANVNRLSVGLQAYNNRLLKLIGRLHTKKQFDKAINLAKQKGFQNINADLILGIPTQKMHHIKKELRHLIKLKLPHISAYGLIVEENTKLCQNLNKGIYKLPSEELQVKMYDFTKEYLKKHGVEMYEVSNFAKQGYESKHNLKYWTDNEYLGLGLTSSSYINSTRWKNTDNFENYFKQIELKTLEKCELEHVDVNSQIEECVMLGLRTKNGISLSAFESKFGFDLLTKKKTEIKTLIDNNLIKIKGDNLFCTDQGFKLLNQVILALID